MKKSYFSTPFAAFFTKQCAAYHDAKAQAAEEKAVAERIATAERIIDSWVKAEQHAAFRSKVNAALLGTHSNGRAIVPIRTESPVSFDVIEAVLTASDAEIDRAGAVPPVQLVAIR